MGRRGPRRKTFWERVDKTSGCWLWTGAKSTNGGYGYFIYGRGGQKLRAHRVAWEMTHGPIPEGWVVMHLCDNPLCVNPDHLEVGTQADNVLDMRIKDRNNEFGFRRG